MDMSKPLAYRMSPKTLDDYVGQEHILGKDKILYRTIKKQIDYLALYYGDLRVVEKHHLLELLVIQQNANF